MQFARSMAASSHYDARGEIGGKGPVGHPSLNKRASPLTEYLSELCKLRLAGCELSTWYRQHANDDCSRFIGVTDLASVRFSLPSQLLEPTPNLEYWTYLDAPNAFVAIGTSDEPLDRMLEVIRFWLTKDLKYAKGKPCKPYNSCLGEFFRVSIVPPSHARHCVGSAIGPVRGVHIANACACCSATGRRKIMLPG